MKRASADTLHKNPVKPPEYISERAGECYNSPYCKHIKKTGLHKEKIPVYIQKKSKELAIVGDILGKIGIAHNVYLKKFHGTDNQMIYIYRPDDRN